MIKWILENKTKYDSSKSQTSQRNGATLKISYGDGSYVSGTFINDTVAVCILEHGIKFNN